MSTSETTSTGVVRCAWASGNDPLMQRYHDEEWGKVERDGRALWEKLSLDAFQAGLSWRTILHKREAFRKAFAGFVPAKVARFGEREIETLMGDAGIVRNRAKITAVLRNARAAREVPEGLSALLWSFAPRGPRAVPASLADVPANTAESVAMARELKRRGFAFVGPTTAYALMQATGMVDDHVASCFRAATRAWTPPQG